MTACHLIIPEFSELQLINFPAYEKVHGTNLLVNIYKWSTSISTRFCILMTAVACVLVSSIVFCSLIIVVHEACEKYNTQVMFTCSSHKGLLFRAAVSLLVDLKKIGRYFFSDSTVPCLIIMHQEEVQTKINTFEILL